MGRKCKKCGAEIKAGKVFCECVKEATRVLYRRWTEKRTKVVR